MMGPLRMFLYAALLITSATRADELLFQDDFVGKLQEGWSWLRENPKTWRRSNRGLEIRIEPGNMWGPSNDAKNVLPRNAPEPAEHEIAVSVTVSNRPTHQYEQVDLVW